MCRIQIENYTVYILGFRRYYVEDPASLIGILREVCKPAEIQVLRADCILNLEHIQFAILYALKSIKKSVNIAKTLPLEILLKIAAEDQIDEALSKVGLKKGEQDIVILILSENDDYAKMASGKVERMLGRKVDLDVLKPTEDKIRRIMELFSISEDRLKAEHMYPDVEAAILNILMEDIALTMVRR
jgi:tRNA threonylcarbamoyladenosine modification (KEOPS) complex Cgi121 subunit